MLSFGGGAAAPTPTALGAAAVDLSGTSGGLICNGQDGTGQNGGILFGNGGSGGNSDVAG
ncbi:PE family protein, partial [Enterococcus faecium]